MMTPLIFEIFEKKYKFHLILRKTPTGRCFWGKMPQKHFFLNLLTMLQCEKVLCYGQTYYWM